MNRLNFCSFYLWLISFSDFFLISCIPIFYVETEQGVAQAIIRSVIDFRRDPWPRVSENAKDLVRKMLNPDPKRRLTAQEVLGTMHTDFTSILRSSSYSLRIFKQYLKYCFVQTTHGYKTLRRPLMFH